MSYFHHFSIINHHCFLPSCAASSRISVCLSPVRSLGHLTSWLSVPLCPASVPVTRLCGACGLLLCACLHWRSGCRLGSPETAGPEMWTPIVRDIACSVLCASAAQMTGCPGVRERGLLSSHTQAMVVSIPEWVGQPRAPGRSGLSLCSQKLASGSPRGPPGEAGLSQAAGRQDSAGTNGFHRRLHLQCCHPRWAHMALSTLLPLAILSCPFRSAHVVP